MSNIPESSLIPPEDTYIMADCQHEVYEAETYVYWKNEKGVTVSLCPDCFWDRIRNLPIDEVAQLMGCDYETVERR